MTDHQQGRSGVRGQPAPRDPASGPAVDDIAVLPSEFLPGPDPEKPDEPAVMVQPGTVDLPDEALLPPVDQDNVPILEDVPGDPAATPDRAQTDLDTGTGPD